MDRDEQKKDLEKIIAKLSARLQKPQGYAMRLIDSAQLARAQKELAQIESEV